MPQKTHAQKRYEDLLKGLVRASREQGNTDDLYKAIVCVAQLVREGKL